MQATARQLGQNLRMPGFRKGKVPPPVVIQRIGRESVLDETVRGAIGRWYLDAIDAAGIHPVGDPDLDLGDLPGEGQPLTFTIEIGVRPTATLGEYKGVEVGKREAGADDAAVDAELEALRERSARLETAEDAAAGGRRLRGHGLRRLHRRRDLRRAARGATSSSSWAPGASCPASRSSSRAPRPATSAPSPSTSPTTTARPSWRARRRSSPSRSRRSSARTCPALDDDFASDAAGFDTLAELREDIAAKLREADESRVEAEFREAVLDAVVRDAKVEVPGDAGRRARPGAVGAHAALAQPPGHRQGGLPADRRARRGRRSSRRPSPTPSRRCAARPSSPRSSRPRTSSPPRATSSTRCRRPPRASARRPRSCATAWRRPAAWTTCARTSPSAPRSTCWPRTRLRYPSSRPRRVTSCGHRADKAATTRPSRLWTPGARD